MNASALGPSAVAVLSQSLAFWLIGGALLGVVARAVLTEGQTIRTRETGQDAFLGILLAVAWVYPLPLVQTVYPPFDWPWQWPQWVPGLMFGGFVYLFIDMGKRLLLKRAPELFAKYTGQPVEDKKP